MGRLFYLPERRHGMLVPLPRPICLPAEGLMKAQGHLVQMANIHQRSNMSNAEGRAESSAGRRKGIGSVRRRFLNLTNPSAMVLLAEMFVWQQPLLMFLTGRCLMLQIQQLFRVSARVHY